VKLLHVSLIVSHEALALSDRISPASLKLTIVHLHLLFVFSGFSSWAARSARKEHVVQILIFLLCILSLDLHDAPFSKFNSLSNVEVMAWGHDETADTWEHH
jgi:hypothetical protein